MNLAGALAYLDSRATYDKTGRVDSPSLDKIERLLSVQGDPHRAYRVIHVTGTNGKGSTTQIITRLLMASGLRVGTYSSPHLETVNERIQLDGEAISDEDFAAAVGAISEIELLAGVIPSYFEIVTAAAFRWFADVGVDVAVVEVGMLGRWDATNVVQPDVSVITNIALDHMEFAGPTLEHIAREKAGIIKAGAAAVVGERRESLHAIFAAEPCSRLLTVDVDFRILDNQLALGGRALGLQTPRADYDELFLPLHGAHQGDNALVALVAAEEFFGSALAHDVVAEAFSGVVMPGRFEVMGHQPLVIVDGAHNPAGADTCATVFFDDFAPPGRRILVAGALRGRDLAETFGALRADEFDLVVCCTAPSPRGCPADEVAAALRTLGCEEVESRDSVESAIDFALRDAGADDAVLVAGSLYVVGAARPHLRKIVP